MDITSFSQPEGESLYESWERFKELLRKCPHHGLPEWLIVQTFYNGLTYATKLNVDATAGGALMGKSAEEARDLIEETATNSYQWGTLRGNMSRPAGMLEVDSFHMITAKLEELSRKIDKQAFVGQASQVTITCCTLCGGNHDTNACVNFGQVQYVGNYDHPPQNNQYSNNYNSGWKNHSNFGWLEQGAQQRRLSNPPGFQAQQHTETKPAWEVAFEKLSQITAANTEQIGELNRTITTMQCNFDTQIGQLAEAIKHRNQGELPRQPEVNPREHVKAITLRSGTQLDEPPMMKKTVQEERKEYEGEGRNKEEREGNEEERNTSVSREEIPREQVDKPSDTVLIPPVPFPQRLKKANEDAEFNKFVKILKNLHINIPFADAILQISSYAKFLKDLIT